MPTILLNKGVFSALVGKEFSDEVLRERIGMMGTALEGVFEREIEVEVFPNRPDLLSEQGFARAFSAFMGVKTGLCSYEVKKSGVNVVVDKSVTMRPFTACAIVKKLKFDDAGIRSIMQVQEKLSTTHGRRRKKSEYGLYPLGKINFPVSYVAKDPKTVRFRPLGFKAAVRADKVEELHPTGREFKEIARGWTKYPFFIDHKGKVLSMLPYTNSEDLGKVTTSTNEVFIECTGTDLQNVMVALNILTAALADMGGEVYSVDVVYPEKTITTPNFSPKRMRVDREYLSRRVGVQFSEADVKKYLERMGYGYSKGEAFIPAYRADVMHQADLAEDVAIAFGYENVKAEIPQVATIGAKNPFEHFLNKVREVLVGLGLVEVKNYHLLNLPEQGAKMRIEVDAIKLANANEEYDHLRAWLAPSLLKTLGANVHNEYPQNVFELGMVFSRDKKAQTKVKESTRLGVVLCHEQSDFTQAKQVLNAFAQAFGFTVGIRPAEHGSFLGGRVGKVEVSGKECGWVGEVHPEVLLNWGVATPAALLEIDVSACWLLREAQLQ